MDYFNIDIDPREKSPMKEVVTRICFTLLVCLGCPCEGSAPLFVGRAHAQEVISTPKVEEQAVEVPSESARVEAQLSSILTSKVDIDNQLRDLQRQLQRNDSSSSPTELRARIKQLTDKHEDLTRDFADVASQGAITGLLARPEDKPISWSDELEELIRPLIQEVKALTSRPRDIARLKKEVEDTRAMLESLELALDRLSSLKSSITSRAVMKQVKELESEWRANQKVLANEFAVTEEKLTRKQGESYGVAETVENIFQLFFRSRGRHLIIAVLGTFIVWLILRRIQDKIRNVIAGRAGRVPYGLRLLDIGFVVFSVAATAIVFLSVLYIFGDWVLLILATLLGMGLVWASKELLPKFWVQTVLLLNMGPVRQGERVKIDGIPWLVEAINWYTTLVNPQIEGGRIRLPINDLSTLRSRPLVNGEPWFPTQKGDWVILSDENLYLIERQSLEFIKLQALGGEVKFVAPQDFCGMCSTVISKGYRHTVTFGLDYNLQGAITTDVLTMMENFLRARLDDLGYSEDKILLSVEFKEAGASSLDLVVLAKVVGKLAPEYHKIRRLIQKLSVDACNEHGWTIPFSQLTLHVAKEDGL